MDKQKQNVKQLVSKTDQIKHWAWQDRIKREQFGKKQSIYNGLKYGYLEELPIEDIHNSQEILDQSYLSNTKTKDELSTNDREKTILDKLQKARDQISVLEQKLATIQKQKSLSPVYQDIFDQNNKNNSQNIKINDSSNKNYPKLVKNYSSNILRNAKKFQNQIDAENFDQNLYLKKKNSLVRLPKMEGTLILKNENNKDLKNIDISAQNQSSKSNLFEQLGKNESQQNIINESKEEEKYQNSLENIKNEIQNQILNNKVIKTQQQNWDDVEINPYRRLNQINSNLKKGLTLGRNHQSFVTLPPFALQTLTGKGLSRLNNESTSEIKIEKKLDFTPLMLQDADSSFNNRLRAGVKFNKRMNINSNSPDSNYMKSLIDLSYPTNFEKHKIGQDLNLKQLIDKSKSQRQFQTVQRDETKIQNLKVDVKSIESNYKYQTLERQVQPVSYRRYTEPSYLNESSIDEQNPQNIYAFPPQRDSFLRVNQKKSGKKRVLIHIGNQKQIYEEMNRKQAEAANTYQQLKMEKWNKQKEEDTQESENKILAEKEKNKLVEMNQLLDNMKQKLNDQNYNNIKFIYGERRTNI